MSPHTYHHNSNDCTGSVLEFHRTEIHTIIHLTDFIFGNGPACADILVHKIITFKA